MKTLYLDLVSGISGDMFLGAALELGVELEALERALNPLGVGGYRLHASRQERGSIAGTKFDVHLEHASGHSHGPGGESAGHHRHAHGPGAEPHHSHGPEARAGGSEPGHGRTFADIRELIKRSGMSDWVKAKSVAVFERVAAAEGRIHGQPPEAVHFHEVGAVDSIVDIVGACAALELLGRPRVASGPVVEGMGTIRCAHGCFPLPAPATLEILRARGVSVGQCEATHELVTPTGAALLAEFAETFGPMERMRIERVGYGLGARQHATRPNVLRAILGQRDESGGEAELDWETDRVAVLETNLDDISAEMLGDFIERALREGALDAFHTPVQMKKNRPGTLVTVLCRAEEADRFTIMILTHTSAFGVRRRESERRKLRREVIEVSTPFGQVRVKLGRLGGAVVQAAPEYESCAEASRRTGAPLQAVYEAARRAAIAV
jgi:hypothetical protein